MTEPARTRRKLFFTLLAATTLLHGAARAAETYMENPGSDGDGEVTVGPEYNTDKDLTDQGNPKGKFFEFSMPLAASKIFKGDDTTLEPTKKPVRTERKI